MSRTALVTGAASGFGRALTDGLAARGWRVVAADEVPPEAGWGAAWPGASVEPVRLDLRSDAEVQALAARVGAVDLLVNNAGYAAFGAQEELPVATVADLFDVNVLGVVRVTRAFLPGLRARRGLVVQLSSVAGRTVFPESGFYAATKHAVEALSEALAQETAPFGVRVRVIEPGSFDTGFAARATRESPAPDPQSPYAGLRAGWGPPQCGPRRA